MDENVNKTIEKMAVVVNEKVAEGWQPLGGITPTIYPHQEDGFGLVFLQTFTRAMVRKLDDIAASNAQMTDLKTEINYLNDELTEWLEDH